MGLLLGIKVIYYRRLALAVEHQPERFVADKHSCRYIATAGTKEQRVELQHWRKEEQQRSTGVCVRARSAVHVVHV